MGPQSAQEVWLPCNETKVTMPLKLTCELIPVVQITLWPELAHSARLSKENGAQAQVLGICSK